jgi:hypothetical protein
MYRPLRRGTFSGTATSAGSFLSTGRAVPCVCEQKTFERPALARLDAQRVRRLRALGIEAEG